MQLKQTKEVIPANIKNAIVNMRKLKRWITSYPKHTHLEFSLKNFLLIYPTVTIEDIYKIGWNKLTGNDEGMGTNFDRAISTRFIPCQSRSYLKFVLKLLGSGFKWDESDEIFIGFSNPLQLHGRYSREQNIDENGRTMSYVNLGLVNLDSHSGKQPMNITWKLEEALPAYLWEDAAKLSVG